MILIPALDLRGGACVRLVRGDYGQEIQYQQDPVQVAIDWQKAGARWLHIVDLDGARLGKPVHENIIAAIAKLGLPLQLGGGLRSAQDIEHMLDLGVDRVILGTTSSVGGKLAILARAFPGKIWASIDVDEADRLRIKGWQEGSEETGHAAAQRCLNEGAAGLIFTATGQDGTLQGPKLPSYLSDLSGPIIYAGGIGSYEHLRQLVRQGGNRLLGVIAGRALYDGCLELATAQQIIEEELAHVNG